METCIVPRRVFGFVDLPEEDGYTLCNCSVPSACMQGFYSDSKDNDDLVRCNIHISDGHIQQITETAPAEGQSVDLEGGCVFPVFADLHTHIDKGHTCERSRNPTGNLTGADSSTAQDASFWDLDDVFWCARDLINLAHLTTELTIHTLSYYKPCASGHQGCVHTVAAVTHAMVDTSAGATACKSLLKVCKCMPKPAGEWTSVCGARTRMAQQRCARTS